MTPPTSASPGPEGMCLEQFRVGQRFQLGSRTVAAEDLLAFTAVSGDHNPVHVSPERARAVGFDGPLLQGPFGLAAFFGLWHDAGIARDTVVAALDSRWSYHLPVLVGDTISAAVTITHVRRTSAGTVGVVGRHVILTNQRDERVQSGTSSVLVEAGPVRVPPGQGFFEPAWASELAARLSEDPVFTSATATWDGTIGLRRGDDQVQFRVYRGRVIDSGRRTPLGATFTVEADELTWAELLTGPANDLTLRLMGGDSIRCTGNAYEYLRMSKALGALVDVARGFAQEERA